MTSTPDPMATLSGLVLDNGKRWGEIATPWQVADAEAILAPAEGAPRLSWLGRPKGASKTTDVAGIATSWLLTQARPLDEAFVIAADRDQAARLLRFSRGLIERSRLDNLLEVQTHAIVHRKTGARIVALSADVSGGEGILSPLILVDELPQWGDTAAARGMWDVAFSTIPKLSGLRFVVIGHAGVSGSWQHTLYERFKASPLWRVNDVAGPLPWVDKEVLADQEATLTASQYERRHLNVWSSAEEALVSWGELQACVTLDGPVAPKPGVEYFVGLDIGLKNDATVAAVCHVETVGGDLVEESPFPEYRGPTRREAFDALMAGRRVERRVLVERVDRVRVVLDRMEVWQGSRKAPVSLSEVEAWLLETNRLYRGARVVFDPYQAIGTVERLRAKGVRCEEYVFSQASVGRLAATLHRLLRDGDLALPDDPALLEELSHVRLVEKTPGALRMDHASGRHDDRAIALALAASRLLERPRASGPAVVEYKNPALPGWR